MSNARSIFNQLLATVAVTSGIFGLGTVLAWSSPALPDMIKEARGNFFQISIDQQSWIGSIATLGALAGCPIAGYGVDKLGRKRTMLFCAIPFTLGWILIGFSSNVTMMCAGRFLSGLCGGIFSLCAPVYIGETVESRIRGMFMNAFQLMLVTGILFTYVIGALVTWKTLTLISSVIPLVFLLFVPFIPETPRFLISQGRYRDAENSLCWFRGTDSIALVQKEYAEVLKSIEESKSQTSVGFKDLLKPTVLKPLCISLSLMILEQVSAFNVVIFYCVDIFAAAGTSIDSHWASVIVAIVQVIATIVSTFFVDRAGRRILLLVSEALMGISFIALGTFFYLKRLNNDLPPHNLGWLPLISVILFIIAFSVGIGPLSWTIMGEILHPNVKGLCSAIATSLVWLSAFVVTKIFQLLLHGIGIDYSFWLFSSFSILGILIVYIIVPETKGKTLEEIQILFESKKPSDINVGLA